MFKKNVKVADRLSNSRWSLPAGANKDLQEIGECIRAIRPLNSEQEDTYILYECLITQFSIKSAWRLIRHKQATMPWCKPDIFLRQNSFVD